MTIFSCFERFLGFLYRIFLSRTLGAEGMGIYQITLSVVGVLVTLTASGTPITVSRLICKYRAAKNESAERGVITAGILTSLILSLPLCLALYFFRNKLNFIFTDPMCYDVLVVILPGVVLTSVYAVIRGVFWGNKNFLTYSVIELIEEAVMLVAGFILVRGMTGVRSGAVRAGLAILISYVVSFLISTAVFIIQGGRPARPGKYFAPLIESSVPITLMRTGMSLLGSLVAIIIPARLVAAGLTSAEALSRYGELSGMTLPLLFIPSTVIGSIALVLVPELSADFYERETTQLVEKISKAVKCAVFVSTLIFPVFIATGREIGEIVYSNANSGVMLSSAAIIMLPMSITMITTSILNSLNMEKRTLAYYLVGASFMLLCVWFLPKYTGVYALVIGHFISYLISATLNLILLERTFRKRVKYKVHLAISTAIGLCGAAFGYFLKNILIIKLPTVAAVAVVALAVTAFDCVMMKLFNVFELGDYLQNTTKNKKSAQNA